ncbi:FMN-binding protein [Thermodesulfobacteriota bacterium]
MMDFTWYMLGVLTGTAAIFLWKFSKQRRLNQLAWGGLILGIFLILFSIAWSVGAVLEGVPRAASMGLLLFGLSGVVLLTFTYKYIDVKLEKIAVADVAPYPADVSIVPEKPPEKVVKAASPRKDMINAGIRYMAYISLAIAFAAGMVSGDKDYEAMVRIKFQDQTLTKVNDDPVVFQLGKKDQGPGNYVLIQEGQGYGGPFVLGIRIMEDGKVHEIIPLDHRETPAFAKKIEDANYRAQFMGKSVADDFIVGVDIDAVSGATVTTMAAAEAVRKGAHLAAIEKFKMEPKWKKAPWKFGLDEILILVIFAMAFVPAVYQKKPWKHIYLAATIGIVGFYLNAAISVGSLSGLFMGFIPGITDHIIWWILVVGTVLGIVFLGKNVYCFRICPFYGIQYLLTQLGGSRLNPSPVILKRSKSVVNFLLWLAVMTSFLASHPALGSYEPFAMMFSLNGVGIQWFLLPLALIGSFFMSTFWCRFFCPCGQALTKLRQLRKNILKTIKPKQERNNGH